MSDEAFHDKSPAEKERQREVLQTRKACQRTTTLSFAARLFFTMLLDLALDPQMNFGKRGQVRVGQKKLAFWLGASRRSITTWKRELVAAGFIWMSQYYLPDKDAMDLYHITALCPQHNDEPTTTDAFYGNGYKRHWAMEAGKGARGMVRKKFPMLVNPRGEPVHSSFFAQNVDNQSLYGKNLPREAKVFRCQPKNFHLSWEKLSVVRRKNITWQLKRFHLTAAKFSPHSRKPLRLSTERNRPLIRSLS